ncbi:uncharacterized protein TNIN_327321 [Trichonephila inaurata madagascariensis]|uniref:Uncharacterized protein n=1 Tax=Trichonephila inaurata madagascariensis TaxID=2747483 RepID=A0A8X7BW13_9ARAC|nr:uncharacterized protein TNIN_327321 [Trichonephila inaurata madagascariensis]
MSAITSKLNKSRSSTNSSRCGTPKPAEPIAMTDCEKRRLSIERIEHQNVLIEGYKRYLVQEKNTNGDKTEVYKSLQEALIETLAARDDLVSELRILPPCLDENCSDHLTLKPKNNDCDNNVDMIPSDNNSNSKKSSHKRKKSKGSSDGFVFRNKTARPITPTPVVLKPIETNNTFDNLEQDSEIPQSKSPEIPVPKPPSAPMSAISVLLGNPLITTFMVLVGSMT